jgi:uncharacterized protein
LETGTLTKDEEQRVHLSVGRVAARVSQELGALQALQTPESLPLVNKAWQAIQVVASLHTSIDAAARALPALGPQPECKAGCSTCCYSRVEISDPEALRIARHLREGPKKVLAQRTTALKVQAAHRAGRAGAGADIAAPAQRQACSFLEDGLCSIYAIRPAVCRKAHSLSAAHCHSQAAEIPQDLGLILQSEVLIAGTKQAFVQHQLPYGRHELAAGVLAALASESAAQVWYAGQPLEYIDRQL